MKSSSGKPPFVTLIYGDEPIGMTLYRQSFYEMVRAYGGRDVEEYSYVPGEEPIVFFTERMLTPSLFANTRIFSIRHIGSISADDSKELQKTLVGPIEGIFVFIEVATTAQKGEKGGVKTASQQLDELVKFILKKSSTMPGEFVCKEFRAPREYEKAKWLVEHTPRFFGRKISIADAQYLIDLVGSEIEIIYSELQKLDIHLAPSAPIDKRAITLVCGANRSAAPFELAQAVAEKNIVKSMEIIEAAFFGNFSAPLFISSLFRQFWAMLRIRKYAAANPEKIEKFLKACKSFSQKMLQDQLGLEIGIAAGLLGPKDASKVFPLINKSGIVTSALNYTVCQLQDIMRMLLDIDVGVKTGRIQFTKTELQLLCYRIIRIDELKSDNNIIGHYVLEGVNQ